MVGPVQAEETATNTNKQRSLEAAKLMLEQSSQVVRGLPVHAAPLSEQLASIWVCFSLLALPLCGLTSLLSCLPSLVFASDPLDTPFQCNSSFPALMRSILL